MRIILTVLLHCSVYGLSAQLSFEKDFKVVRFPIIASNNWFMLNHASDNYFKTEIVNGNLQITITDFVDSVELKIPGGRLLGIDNGEFGGKLRFIPDKSNLKEKTIMFCNPRFIFSFAQTIYFIEGLAHGFSSDGGMYKLDTIDQQFTPRKVIEFGDAPEAMSLYDNKILIAAHNSFFVVDEKLDTTKMFDNAIWRSLYPSSIAVKDMEHVYLGVRGGIFELNLSSRTFLFYLYKKIPFGNRDVDFDTPTYNLKD